MSGVLLRDGQTHFLNILFGATPVQDYYLGIMENVVNPVVTAQIGSGIVEIVGTNYNRLLIERDVDWSIADGLAASITKIFNIGPGGWNNCNGYIVCRAATGNNAVFAQVFPEYMQGDYGDLEEIEVAIDARLLDTTEPCGI